MLFDTYNPWAALVQLNSTHPLTGRRVAHLGEIAKAKGQAFADYDVEAAAARVNLNRGKLWGQFLGELLLLMAPLLFGLAVGPLRRLAACAGGHRAWRAGDAAAPLSVPHAEASHRHGADG